MRTLVDVSAPVIAPVVHSVLIAPAVSLLLLLLLPSATAAAARSLADRLRRKEVRRAQPGRRLAKQPSRARLPLLRLLAERRRAGGAAAERARPGLLLKGGGAPARRAALDRQRAAERGRRSAHGLRR